MKRQVLVNTEQIKNQAIIIRDVAQAVIDACNNMQPLDPYARNKLTGGSLAQDAAALGIMIVVNELEYELDE